MSDHKIECEPYSVARSGHVTAHAVDSRWQTAVYEYLAERNLGAKPERRFDLIIRTAPTYEADPVFEPVPRGWWPFLRHVRRCFGYSWREATGALREVTPREEWKLAGVTIFSTTLHFAPGELGQ